MTDNDSDAARRAAPWFFAGVFVVCMSVLMLQIAQTRVLSVMAYYHLAFFAISSAMFGLTAGALYVYYRHPGLSLARLMDQLARMASLYAAATALCFAFQLTSYAGLIGTASVVFVWAKLIMLLAPPFALAGAVISLALTRSPYPIGRVYGVDLIGAALGCLVVLGLLETIDAPSAVLAVAAMGALAACLFLAAARRAGLESTAGWVRPGLLLSILIVLTIANALTDRGLQPVAVKRGIEHREDIAFEGWNSFSRIMATHPFTAEPFLWGASPVLPKDLRATQLQMNIDGEAGTWMQRYQGLAHEADFLEYDVTNLAYALRHRGEAAVIGVGGGRDVLAAHHFGFRDITAVEINPIFVRLLTDRRHYRDFAGLAGLPHVNFVVDEARSWFARTTRRFDLVQMSMVDTWAATGAGAFSLSENGLYTVEAWAIFLRALKANGVFTVSRWYSPDNVNETGRAVSLALGALFKLGAAKPSDHVVLVGQGNLSTIVISPQPLSEAERRALIERAEALRHAVLLAPGRSAASALLADLAAATSYDDLERRSGRYAIDITPATDSRPFFFNQLRLTRPDMLWSTLTASSGGVVKGNLIASATLTLIIVLSALFVLGVVVWPARGAIRQVERPLVTWGTLYFLLIGLGFMFVEIGLIQRMSLFLGHPIYSLSIVLFSFILSTGLGSLVSDRFALSDRARLTAWAGALALYVALLPAWLPDLLARFESAGLLARAGLTVATIAPAGLLMGFGFPTGMRLALARDSRPTPWFWGINGAAGVLAAGLAVACSIALSIDATLRVGALCYAFLLIPALMLLAGDQATDQAKESSATTPA